MTVAVFLIILTVCASITSLLTEGIKKLLDSTSIKYSSNIIVLITAVVVGAGCTVLYYLYQDIAWTTVNIVSIFLMALANWLGAMIGYDKVKQTIMQISSKEGK